MSVDARTLHRAGRFRAVVEAVPATAPEHVHALVVLGALDDAQRLAREGLAASETAGAAPAVARWLEVLCDVAVRQGRVRAAVILARRGVALHTPDPATRLPLRIALANALASLGDLQTPKTIRTRVLEEAEASGDAFLVGMAHLSLGSSLAHRSPETALDHLDHAASCLGPSPYWLARVGIPRPMALRLDPQGMYRAYVALLPALLEAGDAHHQALIHIGAAAACRRLGRLDDAEDHSLSARRLGSPAQVPLAHYGLSEVARLRGNDGPADEALELALASDALSRNHREMLALSSLGSAARRGDLVLWNRRLRAATRQHRDDPEGLWAAFDASRSAGLPPRHLVQLGALAWGASDTAQREARAADLTGVGTEGWPCGGMILEAPLGAGGMATVWAASPADRPDEALAVKFVDADPAVFDNLLEAFEREVRALASLAHPGIVPVMDRGSTGAALERLSEGRIRAGTPWMSMPLAKGGALSDHCGALRWPDLHLVLHQILDALATAHGAGVLHLDLKPDNVLLATEPPPFRTLIADFGLARALWDARPKHIAGTPAYMAPEQFQGDWRSWGPATDLYGVGCVAYHLVAGHPPFEGSIPELRRQHLGSPVPGLASRHPMPDGLQGWIETLMAKDPDRRFPSAAAAMAALENVAAGRPVHLPTPTSARTASAADTLVLDAPEARGPRPTRSTPPAPARATLPVRPHWERPRVAAFHSVGLATARQLPVVGRDREKTLLWDALRDVATGHPRIVLLVGERGLGARRIGRWLAHEVRAQGLGTVLRASFGAAAGTRGGFRGMVTTHTRSHGLAGPPLHRWLERCPWRPPSLPVHSLVDAFHADLDPELAMPMVVALARQGPVLLLLENVHDAPDAMRLARRLAESDGPVLVVATCHPQGLDRLGRTTAAETRHVVGPLDPTSSAQLADSIWPLEPRQRDELVDACDGVPARIVSTLRDWLRRGLLDPSEEDGRARVPETELDTLRMHGGPFEVVQGPVPEGAHLLAVLGGDAPLEALAPHVDLDALTASAWATVEEDRVRLVDGARRRLLQQASDGGHLAALHDAAADIPIDDDPALTARRRGRHLLAAGRPAAAAQALLEAVRLFGDFVPHALFAEWEEALHAAGTPEDDPVWLEGWSLQVMPLFEQARQRPEHEPLLEALAARGSEEQRCIAALARATDGNQLDIDALRSLGERILATPGIGPALRGRAALFVAHAALRSHRLDEARRWTDRASELLRGHPLRVAAQQLLGIRRHLEGANDEARDVLTRCVLACRSRRRQGLLEIHSWQALGDVYRAMEDLDEAERCYREALVASRGLAHHNQFLDELNLIGLDLARGRIDDHAGRLPQLTETLRTHSWIGFVRVAELIGLAIAGSDVPAGLAQLEAHLEPSSPRSELASVGTMVVRHLSRVGRRSDALWVQRFVDAIGLS